MPESESIAFDRAAAFYDETRGLPADVQREVTRVLAAELGSVEGTCLEVGVGTGRMAGCDLSVPMMQRLVENAGGAMPFPLAQADGTRLPFRDDVFGAGMAVHVLHLVREWRDVVLELVRAIRPGGRLLVNLGGAHGIHKEVTERFLELAPGARRIGLTEPEPLDELMASLGASPARLLERVELPRNTSPIESIERFAGNQYSGTWRLTDGERMAAVEELRRWVDQRWDDPEVERPDPVPIQFRSYQL